MKKPHPYSDKLKAAAKRDFLWEEKILPSVYTELPSLGTAGMKAIVSNLKAMSLKGLALSFDHASDEMPRGRTKFLHPYGSVAKIKFTPSKKNTYTGLWQGGSGLIRLSLAGAPAFIGYTPAAALKFFISGHPSADVLVMNSVNGQGEDYNFFALPFSNEIPPAQGIVRKVGEMIFKLVKEEPNKLPVTVLSERDAEGKTVDSPRGPDIVTFVPSTKMKKFIDPASREDFREHLRHIPEGSTLYEVYEGKKQLGTIELESPLLASLYGDEKLFFRHPR